MTVPLSSIRDLLLPGLMKVTTRYSFGSHDWRGVFGTFTVKGHDQYGNPIEETIEVLEKFTLDPPFSLDELESAQTTIDNLAKK